MTNYLNVIVNKWECLSWRQRNKITSKPRLLELSVSTALAHRCHCKMAYIATQRTGLASPAHHNNGPIELGEQYIIPPSTSEVQSEWSTDPVGFGKWGSSNFRFIVVTDCTRLSLHCIALKWAFVFMHKIYFWILYKSIYTVYIMSSIEVKQCCLPKKTINTTNLQCTFASKLLYNLKHYD